MQAAEEATVLLVSNANGQTDQLAQAQTEDAEKDSVIVVMGPSSEPEAGFDPV